MIVGNRVYRQLRGTFGHTLHEVLSVIVQRYPSLFLEALGHADEETGITPFNWFTANGYRAGQIGDGRGYVEVDVRHHAVRNQDRLSRFTLDSVGVF